MKWRAARGEILGLRRQVCFRLHCPGGHVVARYYADAVYIEGGRRVVEDTKPSADFISEAFRIKERWMKFEHGITIRLVYLRDPTTW